MKKKEIEAVARQVDGKINEVAGKLLSNDELEEEGREEQRDAVVSQTVERMKKVQELPVPVKQ